MLSELAQTITENNINKVKALLESGQDANQMYDERGTVLMYACAHEYIDIASLLLQHGADVHTVVNDVVSALRIACASGNIELVKLLLKHGANANEKFPSYLPEHPDRFKTPLVDAIERNAQEIVNLLIQHGADLSVQDHYSLTPLHNAAWLGYVDIVNILLHNGASVNATTDSGETPLYKACLGGCGTPDEGRIDVVKLLLDKGADPNVCPSTECPLQAAYDKTYKLDDIEIIKLLIKHGADVYEHDIRYFEQQRYQELLDMIKSKKPY